MSRCKLDIGCSLNRREDTIALDLSPRFKPDVVADGRALPFRDGTFMEVTASHVLEHIPVIPSVFPEWLRGLKPGGTLVVTLPDVLASAKLAEDGLIGIDWFAQIVLGDFNDEVVMWHKSAWTPKTLERELTRVGFRMLSLTSPDGWQMTAVAQR